MTTRTRWIAVVLGAVLVAGAPAWAAEEKKMEEKKMEMTPEMEAWAKLAQPGEAHKKLEPMVGKWATTVKVWPAPGQPPAESTGTAEMRWILGGRYVESIHHGTVMGQPFEGHGLEGYDNQTKKYVSTWVDNMSTAPMISHGDASADGKTMTYTSEFTDPMTNQKMTNRTVTTWVDKDTFKYESFIVGADGKEFKNLEVTGKRQ